MKGQRNEGSLLFSLDELAALTGGAGAPARSEPRRTGEGSGLVDLRAMAAQTRASSRPAPGAPGAGVTGGAPRALPTTSPHGGDRAKRSAPAAAPSPPRPEPVAADGARPRRAAGDDELARLLERATGGSPEAAAG